ncbi:hypothetical protein ACKKBF_B34875 [Auxenochlorella protothecoides x Auxenochlorella symbiontica]|uniref:Magnesium transporter n=1 Tax=Auxenochlorella protothecoides TaxID=3075 RepID=A0A1D1ZN44_AUXPR
MRLKLLVDRGRDLAAAFQRHVAALSSSGVGRNPSWRVGAWASMDASKAMSQAAPPATKWLMCLPATLADRPQPPGTTTATPPAGGPRQQRMMPGVKPACRAFHTPLTSQIAALGVVDQMKDTGAIQLPASPGRNFWEVLEFRPDGTVLETWKTPDVLGLHPRDVSVFATDSTLTQRAMLAVRNQAVLLKTETCRAVLYADRAVLFPAHKTRATLRIAQQVKSAVGQRSVLPFELKVLEALMAESVRGLEGKGRRLSVVAETVLNDINSNFSNSSGELQRLLPIQRKLTEVQQDVKDLLEALTCIVEDDVQLKRLCLSDRAAALASVPGAAGPGAVAGKRTHKPGFKELRGAEGGYSRKGDGAGQRSPAMRMAAAILESYEFKLTAVHGYLSELEASMEQTKTVWHMQLDHQRNRVLRVNLLMSIASFAAMSMTVPAAFFGMNLDNRLEAAPGMFMFVVNCSMGTGLLMGGMVYVYYKFGPKRRYKARLRDMRSLRDLLVFHMDDMDDVIQEIKQRGQVTKTEFAQIVRESVQGKPMSTDEINLLYRVFDSNKDGLLELSELLRMEEHMDDFSRTHLQ